ncbi:hypothetical protein [Bosea sp. (in: a-proteobacteria)]|jgi:hypothetical protein|uniref:hypothetical protein n=1 Tax=Bosea sp. (in: a-proteobacteria) TaxID=1871050 RepID=UPI003F6FA438
MRALACVLAMLASSAALSAERLPSFPKDTEYRDARRGLAGLGYKPVKLPESDACLQGNRRCAGFPEMLACSGTGLGHCIFVWRSRRDMLIEIVTVGEDDPTVFAVRCRANCR